MKEEKVPAIIGGIPTRQEKLYYGHQYIDEKDIAAVVWVLKSDFLTCGPKITELEDKLKDITGAGYAVACSNGTAALHMAVLAAGIGKGDEVITTPITFAASANCIRYVGATPVFADINPETYNIDPESVRTKITEKTKAVIAVDYTGQAVELDKLKDICREYGLLLIEDGAHSIGTVYRDQNVGSIADITTFSFHPVKTVTAGEGGAVLTNSPELYRKIRLFGTHGITRDKEGYPDLQWDGGWYYNQVELGYNYRMTDMQAALLISQLDKLPVFKKRRQEIVKKYNDFFGTIEELTLKKEIPESDTCPHLYIIRLKRDRLKISRKEFFDALAAENIICNLHYIPVYYFPDYEREGYKRGICPKAEELYEDIITLPLYYGMSDKD